MGATLFVGAADVVGESVVYDDQRGALLWVDIGGKRIHRVLLSDKRHEVWPAPDFPTSIGLRADGGAILGLRDRVVLWDYGGDFRTFAVVEPDLPDNRLNEGRVGPDGAFWVGTMQNNLHPDGSPKAMSRSSGAIYRVNHDGYVSQLTPREFGITNTMAWTTDGRFLTADTRLNEIYAYDLRAGVLSNKRVFRPASRSWRPRRVVPRRQGTPLELPSRWRSRCRLYRARRRARSVRRHALHVADELRFRWARFRHALCDLGAFHDDGGAHRCPSRGRCHLRARGWRAEPSRASFQIILRQCHRWTEPID
jgi:SMP-30/Gluconolactonase/LRE-like region